MKFNWPKVQTLSQKYEIYDFLYQYYCSAVQLNSHEHVKSLWIFIVNPVYMYRSKDSCHGNVVQERK